MLRLVSWFTLGTALLGGVLPTRALAQDVPTAPLLGRAVVFEQPRGDSLVLATLDAGTVVELLDSRRDWYEIRAVDGDQYDWRSGWIRRASLDSPGAPVADRDRATATRPPQPPLSVRGFAQVGGIFFTAVDSFDAVLDNSRGVSWGGGGRIAAGNGLYFQAEIERTEKTGERVLVVSEELFQLDAPNAVTVTPVLFTTGYRAIGASRTVPYVGVGMGWYRLEETSAVARPSQSVDESHIGYHVVGGAEVRLQSWLSLAGEVQWATVPGGLGDSGVSLLLNEDDLGGTTLRFRILVGR